MLKTHVESTKTDETTIPAESDTAMSLHAVILMT